MSEEADLKDILAASVKEMASCLPGWTREGHGDMKVVVNLSTVRRWQGAVTAAWAEFTGRPAEEVAALIKYVPLLPDEIVAAGPLMAHSCFDCIERAERAAMLARIKP